MSRNVNGLFEDVDTPEIHLYLKLLILLYADDTVLFGASAKVYSTRCLFSKIFVKNGT